MSSIGANASGQFQIGDITINRLGYGAMRITGPGVWGPPHDRKAALATLRRLPELGVDFIDTADSYGPDVSEELRRTAPRGGKSPSPGCCSTARSSCRSPVRSGWLTSKRT
jgi:pyridoxine 4-dehydrogenase